MGCKLLLTRDTKRGIADMLHTTIRYEVRNSIYIKKKGKLNISKHILLGEIKN